MKTLYSIGTTLYDLESSDNAGFLAEAASWDLSLYRTAGYKVTFCWDNYILGGYCVLGGSGTSGAGRYYGQYFYKQYNSLPGHNQVNIRMRVYAIDSWDGTTVDDHFEIGVDSNNVYAFRMNGFDPVWANQEYCGTTTWKDFPPFTVYMSYPHTSGSLLLKVISCANEDSCNESLGFRDVVIEFVTVPVPYSSICAISPAPISSNPCPCANPNMFMYPPNSGICVYCHATCATCNAPNYYNCLSCYDGSYLSGGQCLPCNGNCATCTGTSTYCTSCNPGWFLVGSVCYPTCNSPLYSTVVSGVTYCNTPCPGQYAFWDGTCGTTCAYASNAAGSYSIYPSTVNTFALCNYPCGSTSQVLYWNGTCTSSCPSPLSSTVFHSSTFCDYQCGSAQYLYWNGSCLNNCPSPLSGELQGSSYARRFCWYTCPPTQYLYWNGSCISTCPSPLTGELQGTSMQRLFCWYTCPPTQYLYWNGSCISTCPSPLSGELQGTNLQRLFCWYTCPPSQYLYWNGSCISTCPSPLSGETQGTYLPRKFCWYTCQPGEFLYWNQSCLSTCPSPLTGEMQGTNLPRQFCWYTCQPTEYLYYNKTCLSSCVYPLTGETQGTYLQRNFCWYPCMPWQWIYWDQTCQETCTAPLWPEVQSPAMPRNFCWFPCASESRFLYWNGTCLPECPEPLKTRYQNGQWFCDYPCSSTQYLYWNGSCLSGCPSPLTGVSEGTPSRKFCYYLCPVGQFLYWDQSCQTTCNFPLVPATQSSPVRQFCWYLCPTSQFLYWNGTCGSQCDPPLTQRTTNNRKFCDFNCADNQYLAWNGSCLNTCPYPLKVRVEGSPIKKSFCDYPCAPSQYLYWNGSCLSVCNAPLVTRLEGSPTQRRFCDYPCVGNQYLYWNGTCSLKCNLPLVVRIDAGNKFCDYLCPAGQIMYWDGTCGTSCNAPLTLVSQGTPTRQYCQYKCLQNQFLDWKSTCADTCNFPMTSYVYKARLFCKYSCTGTDYLYFNGSCLGSCTTPYSPRIENSQRYCDYSCAGNNYLYWNGSCLVTCEYPLAQRVADGHQYCDFSCAISTDFLYWNGTCSSTCPYPLSGVSEGASIVRKFCRSGCLESEFLYWNQTCSEKCDFPLTKANYGGSVNYCYYPCLTNEYLYWNGSCLPTCSFPLSTRVDAGLNYCDYPCAADYQFLYWNGSCMSQCESPLSNRTENNKNYCEFPCSDTTQYLYYDQRCSSNCNSPLKSYQEGTPMVRKFCSSTCDKSDYIYWNGSCFGSCSFPFVQKTDDTYRYCNPPCTDSSIYFNVALKKCSSECHVPGYIDNDLGFLRCSPIEVFETLESSSSFFDMFLYAPLEPGTLTVVKLVKIMQYVKYLDIHMPPRLQRLGISKGRNVMSVSSGITMGEEMKKDFFKQSLSFNYEKNRLHSSFLVNFWEDLTTLMIAFALACLFFVGERLSVAMDWKLVEIICHTLRVLAKWNAVIMFLAINLDDIILFSAVEYKSLNKSGSSNGFSFAMSFVFIFAIIGLSGFIYWYAKKLRAKRITKVSRNNITTRSAIVQVNESFQVIFRGYRDNNIFNQLFFMIYMFRIGVPMLVAVCLEVSPIAITILEVLISIAILTYLLKMKPFIKNINHQQIVLFEVIVLIMNFCMFILTILSMTGLHHTKGANILGDIVIIGNDIINIMCLVFLVIKLYNEIKIVRAFIKKNSINKAEATGLYLQLLFVPLQLGNMGFEEMIAYDIPSHQANLKPVKFRKGLPNRGKVTYEMEDDKANISFEYMDSARTPKGATTDRKLLNRGQSNSLINQSKANRLETFGDNEMAPPNVNDYDLESPELMSESMSPPLEFYDASINLHDDEIIQHNHNKQQRQVFIDVDFYNSQGGANERSTTPAQKSSVQGELMTEYSEQNLSLARAPSNDMNLQSSIFTKLSRNDQVIEENKPMRSILKNPLSPGSLGQQDLDELMREIHNGSPDRTSMRKSSMSEMKSLKAVETPQQRGRVYDYGDGYQGRGRSEDEKGWNRLRREFNFREISADFGRKEKSQVLKSRKVDEKVALSLWRSGRQHFKPSHK